MSCSVCGATLVEGARFCSQCGSPIAAPSGERRKTVTVAFIDLVESTNMAEQLDPEALSTVLGRYFALARSVVERRGGTVEKFIGDAVVAMFGVAQLREDDALRAVRAAVEMREAVARLNIELEPAFGVRLRVRTGINTGEVLVEGSQVDTLAVGHAVSMAARLEQAAGPDEILAGEATFRLLGAGVEAVAIEPITVKGSSVPLRAWRIDGLVAAPVRSWERVGTYVGRDAELAEVVASYVRAVAERRSAATLVVAPPGLGKTRFAAEVAPRLTPRPVVAVGRGVADGGPTYGPLVDVLRQLGAGDGTRSGAFETSLEALPDRAQVARAARSLVEATGVATAGEVGWVVRRIATAVASETPLVIVLDDLHWTDPLVLDVVAELLMPALAVPVFVLALTRPELLEDEIGWLERLPGMQVIRLEPLTAEDTEALVGERLGPEADPALRRRIVEAAAGVPLFVEQLAALDAEASSATNAETSAATIPSSIRALMAARVDRITGDARAVVESAAIAGEAFTSGDAIAGEDRSSVAFDVDAALAALVRREIVRPEPGDADAYRFSHALLRDAVIDALPRRRRAELHERRAAVLAASGDAVAGDADLESIGFHLESAWRERTSIGPPDTHTRSLATRAAQALAMVGRRSVARKEWHRAAAILRRAAHLVADVPDTRRSILPDMLDALVFAREIDGATSVHDEGLRLAAGDAAERARIEVAWSRLLPVIAPEDASRRMVAVADEAISLFGAAGDDIWLGRAWMLRAIGLEDVEESILALRETRAAAERSGDERTLIEVWDELGGSMIGANTAWPEILEFASAEVAWARAHGVAFTEADGTLGEAYALAALGEIDAALARIASVKAMFGALPSVVGQAGEALLLEAQIRQDAGELDEALELRTRAIETFAAAGEPRWEATARTAQAHSLIDVGRIDEASASLARLADDPHLRGSRRLRVFIGQARAALAEGRPDDARRIAGDVQRDLDEHALNDAQGIRVHEALGLIYRDLGQPDLASANLQAALRAATSKDDRVSRERLERRLEQPGAPIRR